MMYWQQTKYIQQLLVLKFSLILTVNRFNEMLNPMMRATSSWDLVNFVQNVKLVT